MPLRSAPSGFMATLKSIDRRLIVMWVDQMNRWVIMREDPDGAKDDMGEPIYYRVLTVQNEDGSYRDLDQRTIDWLRENDAQAYRYDRLTDQGDERNKKAEKHRKLMAERTHDKFAAISSYHARAIMRSIRRQYNV